MYSIGLVCPPDTLHPSPLWSMGGLVLLPLGLCWVWPMEVGVGGLEEREILRFPFFPPKAVDCQLMGFFLKALVPARQPHLPSRSRA